VNKTLFFNQGANKMKNLRLIFAVPAALLLFFAGCENGTTGDGGGLPKLTIKNESSYTLTNVTFSGISFSEKLSPTAQAVRPLANDDLNKTGYISFGLQIVVYHEDAFVIECRTETAISVSDEDLTFTFNNNTVVVELENLSMGQPSSTKTLAQVARDAFSPKLAVKYNNLFIEENEDINLGQAVTGGSALESNFVLVAYGAVGLLTLSGAQPVKITGSGAAAFSVVQPTQVTFGEDATSSFKIEFSPLTATAYTGTVTINTKNEANESVDFSFDITATGTAQ
jgi:hypothetical protein